MSTAYAQSSALLGQLLRGEAGLKTLAFGGSSSQPAASSASYALVCETLKFKSVIDTVLLVAFPPAKSSGGGAAGARAGADASPRLPADLSRLDPALRYVLL